MSCGHGDQSYTLNASDQGVAGDVGEVITPSPLLTVVLYIRIM